MAFIYRSILPWIAVIAMATAIACSSKRPVGPAGAADRGTAANLSRWHETSPAGDLPAEAIPNTPVGARIRGLIDGINANNPDVTRAFVESAFSKEFRDFVPMDMHIQAFQMMYNRSGGFEFHSIRQNAQRTAGHVTVAIVKSRATGSWHDLVLDVDPEPPHLIRGTHLALAWPPEKRPSSGPLTRTELVEELRSLLGKLASADMFSGTVLVARDGQIWFKQAFGLASKRFNVPNRVDTKFNLGSMNKMFTGVAAVQLAERGKLSLDDPISKYVSTDWLASDMASKIKVKHLLTHTSGLGTFFTDEFENTARLRLRDINDYKPIVRKSTLAFEPGTDWHYSNTGMLLAGVVIENASGMNYHDYIRRHITGPAGMTNTDCYDMDQPVTNLAIGYSRDVSTKTGWTNNLFKHVVKGGPAGGGFSTVEDLLKFDIALRSHTLLNPTHTDMALNAKPKLQSPEYGFGFGHRGGPGNRIVGHDGGFAGISANLDMYLDSGFTVAVMSNYDAGAMLVSEKISMLIDRLK
ncbi:MAG: beta-lactamase family protein [Proteobacteria bacterium]|nr:beta-lactamase family protein [Pseudomonadota bacterium]